MRKLPPLTALPAFEATARFGSMTDAARVLGRTHGAVSKQLARLSDDLGVELFKPVGTGVELTEAGEEFAAKVGDALELLESAWADAARTGQRILHLGVSSTFAARWLMPRIGRFRAANPGVEVEFQMTGQVLVAKDGLHDCSLSWDRMRFDPGMFDGFERLGCVSFGIVTAPGLDVEFMNDTIRVETRLEQSTAPGAWDTWARLTGRRIVFSKSEVIPNYGLMVQAAASGMGAALVEKRLVQDELDDERLVAPVGFHKIDDGFVSFVSPQGRRHPFVKPFLEWMKEELARDP